MLSRQYTFVVTQSDHPETEPRPLRHQGPDRQPLLDRWRHLPHVDPDKMRQDIDQIINSSL